MGTPVGGNRKNKGLQAEDKVFYLDGDEADDPTAVVACTIHVNKLYAHVLFLIGVAHSFLNPEFAKKLVSIPDEMDI